MADKDWVKVVPHPTFGWQVEINPRECRGQLLVQFEKVAVSTVDVPVGYLSAIPVTPLFNLQLVHLLTVSGSAKTYYTLQCTVDPNENDHIYAY